MSTATPTFVTDRSSPSHWRVTLDSPPINLIDDGMYDAFYDLVGEIEADPTLKVVTFESANPDFFLAHYSSAEPRSRFGVPRWIEASGRLAASGVLSIAVIRGRFEGAVASSRWASTSASQVGRRRSSASPKSALA